jgi:hypothetical protein
MLACLVQIDPKEPSVNLAGCVQVPVPVGVTPNGYLSAALTQSFILAGMSVYFPNASVMARAKNSGAFNLQWIKQIVLTRVSCCRPVVSYPLASLPVRASQHVIKLVWRAVLFSNTYNI